MTRSGTSSRNPYLYSISLLVISLCAPSVCCRRATTRSRTSTWSGSASARTSSPACSPTRCSRALRWRPHLQVAIIIFILEKYLCVLPMAIINSWQHHLQVYVILETLMQTLYFVDKQIIQFWYTRMDLLGQNFSILNSLHGDNICWLKRYYRVFFSLQLCMNWFSINTKNLKQKKGQIFISMNYL